jgi:hypothetical protein
MFARGSWAIFGIGSDSEEAFIKALNETTDILQSTAVARAKADSLPTYGINPYEQPRLDEDSADLPVAPTSEAFKLGDHVYGFWFCLNGFEDVTDPKSKQEALAYVNASKPFKFLKKEEKAHVESLVQASAVASRKQFPVLIDFAEERVYVENTSAEDIGELRRLLEIMGTAPYNLHWEFGWHDWFTQFLAKVQETNKYHKQMHDRAEELKRFKADEVEKLEDKMVEDIVSGYFAMSELETGQWAGLSTPAKIRLFGSGEPSTEASVSTAFSLLDIVQGSTVVSASVVFQNLDSRFNKKGEEKQYRTDLFTIDINDKIDISDAGAAALRGFDLPQYKKDMKKLAKSGEVPIKVYWFDWLVAMKNAIHFFADNVTETLHIDKKLGLKAYESEQEETEAAGSNG